MNITQLRNATVLVEIGPHRLLVDPMLAAAGALPSLKWFTTQRRRNPLVDLPPGSDSVLDRATHALITHCQRGHFDHLDSAGRRWLRQRGLPVLCMPDDLVHLQGRGLNAVALQQAGSSTVDGLRITPVPCLHGEGWVGRFMAHGYGYFIEFPGEPTLYIAGDTVLTDTVKDCVLRRHPDVCIVPAGGAAFDLGGEIIMDGGQAMTLAALGRGAFVANHLEALDHCPTTRAQLRSAAIVRGLGERFFVPEDGEVLSFAGVQAPSASVAPPHARRATPGVDLALVDPTA
ncbi:MBL fold metallo-hydrolase [Eleftheria terrae]|uniref:MBL fold metallo-hydrolase n=1 Tax=Eleftheria terrae TaxID=1597781 RepID=UPI00263BCB38|nr:MBL fold metallo-hydrolase [Eleftheria terrae]WKB55952.1 MBL fold metallo-hydrolase [Eleftheria terrae]